MKERPDYGYDRYKGTGKLKDKVQLTGVQRNALPFLTVDSACGTFQQW